MRFKKSLKNLIFSFGYYGSTVLCSFIMRKIMLITIGLAGVSLNSLFHEVIAMLSLSEMGIGSAIIYNLYKPLAEGNKQKIKELMNLFKRAYFLIAISILFIGLSITPFIQYIVNSTGYNINYIRYIYVLFVIQTAVSYCFAYKRSLLAADQKNYVSAKTDSVFKCITIVVNTGVLIIYKRFDLYLISLIILNLFNNTCVSYKVNKIYPYLVGNKEELSNEEVKKVFSNVKNLFIGKVSGTITNSTDNILISIFVNTLEVGRYANYALIVNAFKQIIVQINNAVQGSVGNLYSEGNHNHTSLVLYRMTYTYFILATVFCSGFLSAATPFVNAIFGAKYIIGIIPLIIITINLYFHAMREPIWQMISVSGLFKEDKYIAITGTLVNLLVSVFIGMKYGISGIFLGTTCTYLIQLILKIILLYNKGFGMKGYDYITYLFKLFILSGIIILTTNYCISLIYVENTILKFFVYGFLSVLMSLTLLIITTFKFSEFRYFQQLFKKLLLKQREKANFKYTV